MNIGSIPEVYGRRTPDRPALVDGKSGQTLTWQQLDRRTNALAAGLRSAHRLESGDSIAMLSTNSTEYFETIFGSARLGTVTAGLNWRSSGAELEQWLDAVKPALLICEDVLADKGAAL